MEVVRAWIFTRLLSTYDNIYVGHSVSSVSDWLAGKQMVLNQSNTLCMWFEMEGAVKAVVLESLRWSETSLGQKVAKNGTALAYNGRLAGTRGDRKMCQGKYVWEVELQRGDRNLSIGVSTQDAPLESLDFGPEGTYLWHLKSGLLYEDGQKKAKGENPLPAPNLGSTIQVHLDCNAGTLGYSVDYGPVIPAFSHLKDTPLYAHAILGPSNDISNMQLLQQKSDFDQLVISDAGSSVINGRYKLSHALHWVSASVYQHQRHPNVVMIRWNFKRWYILDIGRGFDRFPDFGSRTIYYTAPGNTDMPPISRWTTVHGELPLPNVQYLASKAAKVPLFV